MMMDYMDLVAFAEQIEVDTEEMLTRPTDERLDMLHNQTEAFLAIDSVMKAFNDSYDGCIAKCGGVREDEEKVRCYFSGVYKAIRSVRETFVKKGLI